MICGVVFGAFVSWLVVTVFGWGKNARTTLDQLRDVERSKV